MGSSAAQLWPPETQWQMMWPTVMNAVSGPPAASGLKMRMRNRKSLLLIGHSLSDANAMEISL